MEPAYKLLGKILDKFVDMSDLRLPVDDGVKDQLFVTATYDPTSHFEDASAEVLRKFTTVLDLFV